ncbi:MAG: hypothetical protein QM591_14425 [Microbacterium sp.]
MPSTDPTTIGLVAVLRRIAAGRRWPVETASKIAMLIGVKITSCMRMTGAGYAALPRRYSESGMPMLFEFT